MYFFFPFRSLVNETRSVFTTTIETVACTVHKAFPFLVDYTLRFVVLGLGGLVFFLLPFFSRAHTLAFLFPALQTFGELLPFPSLLAF